MPEQQEAETEPADGEQMPEQDAFPVEQNTPPAPPDAAPPLLLDAPAATLLIAAPVPPSDEPISESDTLTADPAAPADEMKAQADEPEQPIAEVEPPDAELTVPVTEPELPAVAPDPPAPEPRRLSRAERDSVDRLQRRFAACGRCGYFIADCLIYLGQETLHDAFLDAGDGWVRMEGDRTFHRLAANAYGIHLDTAFDAFSGTCPECRRSFMIMNTEEGQTRLKIHA